jgi:hypothetical protein
LDEPARRGRVLIIGKYLLGYLGGLLLEKSRLLFQGEGDQLACIQARRKMDLFHKKATLL